MTASPSAILGTALGLTKLAASMRVCPAATSRSMSSTFCAVLRSAGVGLQAVPGGDVDDLDELRPANAPGWSSAPSFLDAPGHDGAEDTGEGDHARSPH